MNNRKEDFLQHEGSFLVISENCSKPSKQPWSSLPESAFARDAFFQLFSLFIRNLWSCRAPH